MHNIIITKYIFEVETQLFNLFRFSFDVRNISIILLCILVPIYLPS